ncbi:MAG: GerAB/ArcD/ProY family transporter [Clostridia bacterium]|nr:GerAB/ArcD/ProY family transporter [Clostridia bacterium]
MKTITNKQLCRMMCISIIALKFLYFPAIVSSYAKNDAYISVLIGLLFDFVFAVIVVCACAFFPGKSFKDILIKYFGKIVFYAIYGIIFVYFMLKTLLAVKEVHHYFLEFLFENFSWIWFAIPIVLLVAYVGAKGLRSVARTTEILFMLIVIGVILTVIIPIKDVNLEYLLPFMSHPRGIVEGIFRTTFVYGDWIILLMCMGDIKEDKSSHKKLLVIVAATYIFVVFFMIMYVGLFKNIGIYKPYAFSDMPLYTDLPNNSARIDWFSSIIWTFALLLQICITTSISSSILKEMFKGIKPVACGGICAIILLAGMIGFYMNLSKLIDVTTSTTFCIATIVLHILLPTILLVIMLCEQIKKYRGKIKHVGKAKKVV